MATTRKQAKPADAAASTSPITNPPTKKKPTTSTTTKKKSASKNTKTKPAPRGARATVGAPKAKATTQRPAKSDAPRGRTGGRGGALEGAYEVLKTATEPMSCKALVDTMAQRNIWSSPGGKTPQATLYAAITREIADKGRLSRFAKAGRGLFTLAKKEAGGRA
ncbi:MAG: winged helix-turn-helix domain-containing protein [Phycisphaerales bacterium]|nr:winged helix-turn-helix domain-containing protein [Phycisphaerales bacterium]